MSNDEYSAHWHTHFWYNIAMNIEQRDRMTGYAKASLYAALAAALIGMSGCAKDDEEPSQPLKTDAGHEMVQLWKDGPYWATKNIGAEKPEEYGCYFWWGDTVGYKREGGAWVASDGSNSNFSFYSGNAPTYGKSNSTLQSEGWITSAGVLAPEHDAAHVHWGGKWRMPTDAELDSLNNNCDWTWTTQNGVNGYVVRGRGDYSSASIFLPASGLGSGTSLAFVGSSGYYWSSVPYSGNGDHAWGLGFDSGYHGTSSSSRLFGRSVRAVQGFTE